MGNTFMNVHICSTDKVDRSTMLQVFKAFKLNRGFVPCEAEQAEMSYLVSYSESDVCSWLTVSGTHWHDNSYEAASDPLGLAQDFRMHSIRFNVDSNGSALIELSDVFGNSAGTRIIGDAVPGEYFTTHLKEDVWQKFLKPLAAEEKLAAVLNARYYTAEEAMSHLAPLLHIRKEQLLMDAVSGEQGADSVWLHFKAVAADVKKVTVKSTFKRIYGDALKPLGFVWAKTKEPCFIRVVNNELIHIIGIKDMKPKFIVPFGGAVTLYRAELYLDRTYQDMANWLPNVRQFWGYTHTDSDEAPDPRIASKFHYLLRSPESVRNTMRASLESVQRWIVPLLDTVQSLQDFSAYYEKCFRMLTFPLLPLRSNSDDRVISYLLEEDPVSAAEQLFAEADAQRKAEAANHSIVRSPEDQKYLDDSLRRQRESIRRSVHSFAEDPEVRQQTLEELERRRSANLELLHTYGVL